MLRLREFWRMRRRTVWVATATLAVVLLTVSALLLLGVGILRAPIPFFHITDVPTTAGHITGVGFDLDGIPTANLLADPSFEPLVYHARFTALEGTADRLTVAADEGSLEPYSKGFFVGADIRVMSITDREMVLRKTAKVSDYLVNRLGSIQEVHLPADVSASLQLFDFARTEQAVIAVGERGTVLIGADSPAPVSIKTGILSDLTGVCAARDDLMIACGSEGELVASTDGVSWDVWRAPTGVTLTAVATTGSQHVAVGTGTVLAGTDSALSPVAVPVEAEWSDVVYGAGSFLACGNHGALMRSANGVVWEPLEREGKTDWICADYRDGLFVVAGTGGHLWLISPEEPWVKRTVPGAGDLIDVMLLTRNRLIVLDTEGRILATDDGGKTWTKTDLPTQRQPRRIAATSQERILLAGADGFLGISQLVNEIVLDAPLVEGAFQPGDLVFLEKVTQNNGNPSITEPWTASYSGAATRVLNDAAPVGGSGSIRLYLGTTEYAAGQSAFLSQILIAEEEANQLIRERLYTASFWLRQEELASREVLVWLTGRFDPVGTVVQNIGAGWKKYEVTFVLPEGATVSSPGEIAFHIGIRDPGTVWIDAVWLGPVDAVAETPDAGFAAALQAAQPDALRLSFLGIGRADTRRGNWAQRMGNESTYVVDNHRVQAPCGSLDTSLRLANQTGSLPWLTIAPYASDAEIRDLIEYLAGPITEPYGKLRMDNGSTQPWTDVFDRIYLEVGDPEDILAGDLRKASFVNHVIGLIQQSPYYPFVRQQLALVDGMEYETALMLSSADYHATPLEIDLLSGDTRDGIHSAYRALADRAPRMPDRPADMNYELIARVTLRVPETRVPTFAEWMETVAHGASEGYGVQLIGVEMSPGGSLSPQTWNQANLVAPSSIGGNTRTVIRLDAAPLEITAYAFHEGATLRAILINHDSQAHTFPLESDIRLVGAGVIVLDEAGRQISKEKLRRTTTAVDVLPGGVTIIEMEEGTLRK